MAEASRIRELNREMNPRKKRPSDNPDDQKKRNKKKKEQSTKVRTRFEFMCNDEEEKCHIFNKMDTIKMKLGEGKISNIGTKDLFNTVFDFYIENNLKSTTTKDSTSSACTSSVPPSYQYIEMENAFNENIFVATPSAITNFLQQVQNHHASCSCEIRIASEEKFRHVSKFIMKCSEGHTLNWYSSPHVEGGKLFGNLKLAHGFFSSGILHVQFEKFCKAANLGTMGEKYLTDLQESYAPIVEELSQKAQEDALLEEIAYSVASDMEDGIGMMTDARHCWRRNSKFTDVVCLGDMTHKVLKIETVSKKDDSSSQRHELIGVRKIYNYLDEEQVPVKYHAHDNNASVIKYLREERGDTQNCNDTWHMTKSIGRAAKKITQGTKKNHGKTWHNELSDKAASIRTHIYWCIQNCNREPDILRKHIANIPEHYKGNHKECHSTSRCKSDRAYESTKNTITTPEAETMLKDFLLKLQVYKNAEDYCYCKDTHYVESFNNSLLQYHDKRIVFNECSYKMRINLSILDWNENVDRPITSRQTVFEDIKAPRQKLGSSVHKRKTYNFREYIWVLWMEHMYTS